MHGEYNVKRCSDTPRLGRYINTGHIPVLPDDGDGASPRNVVFFQPFEAADGPRSLY